MTRSLLALVSSAVLCGCGAARSGEPDDAAVGSGDSHIVRPDAGRSEFVPTEPAAPDIPWLDAGPLGPVTSLPVLTPCPPGWREIPPEDELGPATCDPWPEGGMQECAEDEAHFPGEPGCTRIGPACPTGDWADDLPTDRRILFVRAGAPIGGDGTRERPFGRIADALTSALNGDVIALSTGDHRAAVEITRAVTLWGACTRATRVFGEPASGTDATLRVSVPDVVIRQLTVTGAGPGIEALAGGVVRLESIVVLETASTAISAAGGSVVGREVLVRDAGLAGVFAVSHLEPDDTFRPGRVELERISVLGSDGNGVVAAAPGSIIELVDGAVDGSGPGSSGLVAHLGGTVTARRTVVQNSALATVYCGLGSDVEHVELTEVVLHDRPPSEPDDAGGGGVVADGSCEVSFDRVRVVGGRAVGLAAGGSGALIRGSNLVVTDTAALGAGGAPAIEASAQGAFRVRSCFVSRAAGIGVFASGGAVDASGLIIRDVRPTETWAGTGLAAADEGRLTIEGASLDAASGGAIVVVGPGTTVSLAAVAVGLWAGEGIALEAVEGASVVWRGGWVGRCARHGIYAAGSRVQLRDVAIDGCSSSASGLGGNGILAVGGGEISGERTLVSRARETGIMAVGSGTRIELADVGVRETRERACVSSSCPGLGFGYGVGAYEGASVILTRFAVTDDAVGGVQLASDGSIDLHDGRVSGHAIGANVQSSGFDVVRLFDRVLFVDNDVDVDGSALPVPGPPMDEP